eukprot:14383558-Alexandrium_andersonii.AAC.1
MVRRARPKAGAASRDETLGLAPLECLLVEAEALGLGGRIGPPRWSPGLEARRKPRAAGGPTGGAASVR